MIIIGLTGTFCAGKGTVAEILKEKGYKYYSCSDYLRSILREQGKELTIPNLAGLGNSIREEFGSGELTKRLLKQIEDNNEDKVLVDSLRHPDEIKNLQTNPNFKLISVDAPIKIRYDRMISRARDESDTLSFEDFKSQEEDQQQTSGHKMQLGECNKLANYKIINDSDLEDLNNKVEETLNDIKSN